MNKELSAEIITLTVPLVGASRTCTVLNAADNNEEGGDCTGKTDDGRNDRNHESLDSAYVG